jgi:putative tRNA adenosine deaminase-associated protein
MAEDGFAVAVYRDAGRWVCAMLPPAVLSDLEHCVAALRQQPREGGPFALVDVDDEFFVALRVGPGDALRVLLSDATAAVDWDLARQAVDLLGEEVPADDELDEVWPAGDLGMFADLGLDERELGTILDDLDLYADEMLGMIASRIGVGAEYAQAVEARSL